MHSSEATSSEPFRGDEPAEKPPWSWCRLPPCVQAQVLEALVAKLKEASLGQRLRVAVLGGALMRCLVEVTGK